MSRCRKLAVAVIGEKRVSLTCHLSSLRFLFRFCGHGPAFRAAGRPELG